MELRSALDQFHKRIPEYVITPGGELKYEAMPVRLAPMVGDLLHKVPDLLARDFTAVTPNTTYVGDFKCRRRHFRSYADPWNMPTVVAMVQANGSAEVQKVGIVA
jgi:hypothetical protein